MSRRPQLLGILQMLAKVGRYHVDRDGFRRISDREVEIICKSWRLAERRGVRFVCGRGIVYKGREFVASDFRAAAVALAA